MTNRNQQHASESKNSENLELSTEEFLRIVDRFEHLSGIRIHDHKRVMVQTRIHNRMREIDCQTFQAYLNLIRSDGSVELPAFCNALTTNLTSFFREPHHFDHFNAEFEELAKRERVRVWSAGCSTGEEPYSIAFSAISHRNFNRNSDFRILATDLDTDVLIKGTAGIYSAKEIESFPKEVRANFFRSHGENQIKIDERAKSIVSFKQLNLLGQWPFKGGFDVIFCRNVLIYFPATTKTNLISRFVDALRPGGVLYLGHSERIVGEYHHLHNEGNTTYRKIANAT